MTTFAPHAPVTVAVSGDEHAALVYAVAEAQRTSSPLRLVHAVDEVQLPPTPAGPLVSFHDFEQAGYEILNRAADAVRKLSDGATELEKVVRPGPAARVLVDESSASRLVVLEHRVLSRLVRVFTGSTSTAVAARAHCPVVSVPEAWRPDPEQRVVAVGVDDAAEPAQALTTAFTEAARRDASVLVVHAWRLPRQYEDLAVVTGAEEEWREHARPAIEQAVQRAAAEHPGVKCSVELHYAEVADTLATASEDADLLVLGRRTRRGPLRIGSVARAMIRVARCPVLVVPVVATAEAGQDAWQLEPDELSPQS